MGWFHRWRDRRRPPEKPPHTVPPGTSSLSGLLSALDEIATKHRELLDADVRERLWEVIERRYVKLDTSYEIPRELGMSSTTANEKLHAALAHHLENLVTIAEVFELDSEAERLRSLLNPGVRSEPHGHTYGYFFDAP